MKPTLVFFSVFFAFHFFCSAQQTADRFYEVNGHVLQSKGNKPLEGVYIYAFKVIRDHQEVITSYEALPETPTVITGKDGKFNLKLNGKFEYQISCVKEGYTPTPEVIPFKSNQIANGQHISIDVPMMEFDGLIVKGKAQDLTTNAAIAHAKVELFDLETGTQKFIYTTADGSYFFRLQADSRYVVKGVFPKYFLKSSDIFTTENEHQKTFWEDLKLEKITLGHTQKLPFFFDVNSVDISQEAKSILMDVHVLLASNPEVRFEIGVYTDSRGRDEYNKVLSKMQAESIVTHLQMMGNSLSRLKAVGYGEEKLTNECANGIKCSTEKHLQNRKIVLKVIGWLEE